MALRRSSLLLLGALIASLAVPASAFAQTPPSNDTVATPAGWQKTPYVVDLLGSDAESAVTMRYQLSSGPITDVASGTQVTISTNGQFDFKTIAVDADLMDSGWRSEPLWIDTVLPTDSTDPGTTAWRPTVANVTITAADVTSGLARVEWQLDGGLVQTGASGSVVPINGDGVHTLRTRAVDNATNESAWRDHTIRIDTLVPNDTTAAPSGWQTMPLVVSLTGTDAHSGVVGGSWRLDGGAITNVGAPGAATISSDGVHTLETRITDGVGNTTGWKPHTVRIDTTAPTNLTPVNSGNWTTADYNVSLSGADGGSGLADMQYRIDGGPWVSGTQATVAGSGDHTFQTRAVDVAGNTSTRPVENVRIDRTVPDNTTPAPGAGPYMNGYTVAVTGTDTFSGVDRVEWQVNGGAVQSGPSGTQVTVNTHGANNTLRTRVVDEVGNASAWREDTVNVDMVSGDTVDPVDTTTAASANWRSSAIGVTVSATDSGSGVAELQWRIDGQPMQTSPGANPVAFTIATEGTHLLETRATDGAGNTTAWRRQTFKIDLTVPSDTTAIPSTWQKTRTFTLSATDAHSGIDEIEYTINGGALQLGSDGQVVNVGADGTFVIETRAIDNAGHASQTKTQTLKVDTVLPANTSAVPPGGWLDAPLELALSGTDAASGLEVMQWRVDGGDIEDGGPALIGQDGVHTLETRARDLAGNVSAWRTDTVSVDAAAPANTTPTAPTAWRATAYTTQITGDDGAGSGVDRIERTIDGGAVSNDPNVTIAGDGVYTLRSRIVDEVGHASAWREEVIRIDSAAPQVALSCSSAADAWSRGPVACTVTADGGPSGLPTLTLAGADGGIAAVTSGATATVSSDGGHLLRLDAIDGAGNTAATEAHVIVDRTAPGAGLSCAAAEGKYSCRADASDATSGLAALGWSLDGGAFTTIAAGGTFTVPKGKVRLRAVDVAGNETITDPITLAAIPVGAKVRVASTPVYLAGRKDTQSLVGALSAVRSETGTVSLDLRPLAVGRGTYRVDVKLKAGKRSKKVKRRYKVGRTGALPRISASLSRATAKCTVTLTVRKKVGKRWRRHASTRLVLAK